MKIKRNLHFLVLCSLQIICSGDFDSYPLLHKLVLSNNNLTSIEDDALGRLEMLTILKLDNNKVTQFPASLPSSLIKLYVNNNRITDINPNDLINLINLQVLDLSGNKIIYMPQLALPTLITLSVKSCGLENVNREILRTCPSLRHLLIDGNLIKCSELLEIEQCNESSEALTNEYINDDIEYNQDDVVRKERHLNSISYFPNKGGLGKCKKPSVAEGATPNDQKDAVPNCWNEQKLITSFILANDPTTSPATKITATPPSASTALNDNKFRGQSTHRNVTKGSAKGKNDGNLSSETMKINNNTTMDEKITVEEQVAPPKPRNWQSELPAKSEKMKNSKATAEGVLSKKAKLALPANVVKTAIKALNSSGSESTQSSEAPKQKGLNNIVLMKTKQIIASAADNDNSISSTMIAKLENPGESHQTTVIVDNNNSSGSEANPSPHGGSGNRTAAVINRNLIDYVNGDYGRAQSSGKTSSGGKIKPIKYNESRSSANKSKSIDEVRRKDNKSWNGHNNSVNVLPLVAVESMPEGNNGNENIDATDHQQHMAINHRLVNGEQSEQWNDIRSETINHPGLLIVIAISCGVLFTFIVVYVYRCNFINLARRRRRRGSCETINEGRDVLNDNFNEEIRSFTIESHDPCTSSLTASPKSVNQSDLLPMDILNSTLNQSSDTSHISMHLW